MVTGVGATDSVNNIASFSARGPAPNQYPWNDTVYWARPDWNLIKPDISAPGVNVRSANLSGGYSYGSGTSSATPHVTGAFAILLQRDSLAGYETLYQTLLDCADEPAQGAPYPNNDYGWGTLNVYTALLYSIEESKNNKVVYPGLIIYPNPFSSLTEIKFQSATQYGGQGKNTLKIFDATGRLVKSFSLSTPFALRPTHITWDGTDAANRKLPSGVYFLKFKAGDYSATKKLLLIR